MKKLAHMTIALVIALSAVGWQAVPIEASSSNAVQQTSQQILLAQTCRPRHALTYRGTCSACPKCSRWNVWCRTWNRIQCAPPPRTCPRVCS